MSDNQLNKLTYEVLSFGAWLTLLTDDELLNR